MRSEDVIYDLILKAARDDERIRAVILNGSRANPNAARDIFQDFDIIYLVTEVSPYFDNIGWIQRFGEIMILQIPEQMDDSSAVIEEGFSYLMQFMDGNRIDLRIFPVNSLTELEPDSLRVVLLDKDDLLASMPPPDETSYLPLPPIRSQFANCCNEFWWVCPYVAKGLWRGELTYAQGMLEGGLRVELMKMVTWFTGVNTSFTKNLGKHGKYLQNYLEGDLWEMLTNTYADAGYANTWQALFTMGDLFRKMALRVGDHFGHEYPAGDDERVRAYLNWIRKLPRNGQTVT
jgi:aminoglycoside 6-adenylyltransferase